MPDRAAPRGADAGAVVTIRPAVVADAPPLAELVRSIENFKPAEVACALELVEASVGPPPGCDDYRVLVAERRAGEPLLGYACYGPTPMTRSTFDLYWIASSPAARGTGVGLRLHAAVLDAVRAAGGRRLRVETSTQESYGATLQFYERCGYREVGRIADFYDDGDDLLTLSCAVGA